MKTKPLTCGFIILCENHAVNLLQSTANSLKIRYPKSPFICSTDSSATVEDLAEMNLICKTYVGKLTISSLINAGMNNAPSNWNIIVMAGTTVKWNLDDKFANFIENEKDILFPVADKKWHFVDATLNGLLIHRKTWREIGNMADIGTLEVVKLMWALNAIEKKVKFKAILGAKIC